MTARAVVGLAMVCTLFVLVYARATTHGYVWDDIPTIERNPALDGPLFEGLRATQHSHLDPTVTHLPGQQPAHESYRPLLFLTFAAEVALFGRSPHVMHATNLALGLAAVVLAFDVARRLLRSRSAGLFVAAVFAVHPLQVEPVCYVSARADVLAGLLALTSLTLILRRRGALAALALLASLFTKEATIGLPIVVLAGAWLLPRRKFLWASAWLVGVLPVYAMARAALVANGPSSLANGRPILDALLEIPGVFVQYASLFVLPRHLSTVRPLAHWTLAGFLVVGAAGLGSVVLHRRGALRGGLAGAAFGLLFSAVTLAPATVVALMMGVAADRYAYLPVFGFALTTAALGLHLARGRERNRLVKLGKALAIAAPLALAWVSTKQVVTWATPGTLYANAVAVEPSSSMAHYGMGLVHATAGRWAAAMPEFRLATQLDPTNSRARNNLAVAYLHLGMLDLAESTLRETLAREGSYNFRAWYNLAEVHRARGQEPESCDALRHALAINPGYARAAADLRQCRASKSR